MGNHCTCNSSGEAGADKDSRNGNPPPRFDQVEEIISGDVISATTLAKSRKFHKRFSYCHDANLPTPNEVRQSLPRSMSTSSVSSTNSGRTGGIIPASCPSEGEIFSNSSFRSCTSTSAQIQLLEESLRRSRLNRINDSKVRENQDRPFVSEFYTNNPLKLTDFFEVSTDGVLGEGNFGVVMSAYIKATKAKRAIKVLPKNRIKKKTSQFRVEVEITQAVDHPNIVLFYQIFEDFQYIYFVMEACEGGHLKAYVQECGRLDETCASGAMKQLLRAVRYLHERHICHRDLKSENLLLEKKGSFDPNCNRLKVADFGLATVIPPGMLKTTKVGTPSHMAPEVFERNYDKACDIWSCGVILYFMLFAENPFTPKDVQLNHFRVRFRAKGAEDVSEESRALISSLLTKSVSQRVTAAEALDHPWLGLACHDKHQKCLDQHLVMNLLRYRQRSTSQQLFLNIVSSLLEESTTTAAQTLFAEADSAGSGFIDLLDYTDGLPKYWRDIITKGSGELCLRFSFTEFLAATLERHTPLTKEACRTAFSLLDTDSDGQISRSEVMIHVRKSRFTPTQIAEMAFPDVDKQQDVPIDLNSFWKIVTDKSET